MGGLLALRPASANWIFGLPTRTSVLGGEVREGRRQIREAREADGEVTVFSSFCAANVGPKFT